MATKRRIERLIEVAQVCAWCLNGDESMTSHQIAFWVGMKPSSHFNKILMDAVDMGLLRYDYGGHRPNVQKRLFRSTPRGRMTAKAHQSTLLDGMGFYT